MNKHLRKIINFGLATLIVVGSGAFLLATQSVNASINPDNYGIDVFPNKQTHNQFAYQLRNRGHNSKVYYSSKNSKLGYAIFGKGVPNNDYSNYMDRYHHKLFKSVTKKLKQTNGKRRAKTKKQSYKMNVERHRRNKRNRRVKCYNRKVRKARRSKAVSNKKATKKQSVLKSHFKRSNNKKALKRSGFFDAHAVGGDFVFNKYAPNDKRAVVPKRFNSTNWYKGKFGQLHPIAYYYVPAVHGWLKLK